MHGVVKNMQKIEKIFFEVLYSIILLFLVFVIFVYDKHFFLGLTVGGEVLQLKHLVLFYGARFLVVCLIMFVIFFKSFIWKKRREFLMLLISLAIVFFILEIGVRIMVCNGILRIQVPGQCGIQDIYSPHHYLNFYGTPNYISENGLNIHNSLGYRGGEIETPKPKNMFRIITIGGSTTYNTGIEFWKDDFARQLQEELKEKYENENIEVINAGLGSWNTWESLINLEFKLIDLEPDMIIIYHGINDVTTRIVNPSVYKSDNSGLRKQWQIPKIPFIFHSALLRYLANYQINLLDIIDSNEGNEGMEYSGFTEKLNNTAVGVLDINKPIYFERNLRSMIAIAEEYDIDVLLSTFAISDEVGVHSKLPSIIKGVKQHNEVIKKVAELKNVSLIDFESQMPKDARYWGDGIHLTKEGIGLKAELFTRFIKKNNLIV